MDFGSDELRITLDNIPLHLPVDVFVGRQVCDLVLYLEQFSQSPLPKKFATQFRHKFPLTHLQAFVWVVQAFQACD